MNQSNVVPENVSMNSLQCIVLVPPKIIIWVWNIEPSGVQTLKNPNPLKDVEALAVLAVAVLV